MSCPTAKPDEQGSALARWDHAKWLQDRLGDARSRLAWIEDALATGARHGETPEIRAWCALTLETFRGE